MTSEHNQVVEQEMGRVIIVNCPWSLEIKWGRGEGEERLGLILSIRDSSHLPNSSRLQNSVIIFSCQKLMLSSCLRQNCVIGTPPCVSTGIVHGPITGHDASILACGWWHVETLLRFSQLFPHYFSSLLVVVGHSLSYHNFHGEN